MVVAAHFDEFPRSRGACRVCERRRGLMQRLSLLVTWWMMIFSCLPDLTSLFKINWSTGSAVRNSFAVHEREFRWRVLPYIDIVLPIIDVEITSIFCSFWSAARPRTDPDIARARLLVSRCGFVQRVQRTVGFPFYLTTFNSATGQTFVTMARAISLAGTNRNLRTSIILFAVQWEIITRQQEEIICHPVVAKCGWTLTWKERISTTLIIKIIFTEYDGKNQQKYEEVRREYQLLHTLIQGHNTKSRWVFHNCFGAFESYTKCIQLKHSNTTSGTRVGSSHHVTLASSRSTYSRLFLSRPLCGLQSTIYCWM
jgi:hypothetical protein